MMVHTTIMKLQKTLGGTSDITGQVSVQLTDSEDKWTPRETITTTATRFPQEIPFNYDKLNLFSA